MYFQVFRLPDTMMHHCSSDKDLLKAYKRCDEMLGELMEREDLEIIVLSDHGAVKATRRFSVNTWLEENGYLETKSADRDVSDRTAGLKRRISEGLRSLALDTKVTTKHLLPVYDRPMIYYPLDVLGDAGIDEVLLVSGEGHAGDFLELLGDGSQIPTTRKGTRFQF
ncbi:MAG: alkaline phosphatase family protein [Candidatus Nanohaloarchaea archaeon]